MIRALSEQYLRLHLARYTAAPIDVPALLDDLEEALEVVEELAEKVESMVDEDDHEEVVALEKEAHATVEAYEAGLPRAFTAMACDSRLRDRLFAGGEDAIAALTLVLAVIPLAELLVAARTSAQRQADDDARHAI